MIEISFSPQFYDFVSCVMSNLRIILIYYSQFLFIKYILMNYKHHSTVHHPSGNSSKFSNIQGILFSSGPHSCLASLNRSHDSAPTKSKRLTGTDSAHC